MNTLKNDDCVVEALIEIPMGTKNKYEIDKLKNRIKLDRVLYTQLTYPAEYGYIEETLADDKDPLDILVIATEKTFPGCIVDARIIGYLDMIDNGEKDEKIIAVVATDPRFTNIHNLSDLQEHTLIEIKHFFQNYKTLQLASKVEVLDFHPKEDAIILLERYKNNYKNKQ